MYQEPYLSCYNNIDPLGLTDDTYQIVTIYISQNFSPTERPLI